MYKEDFLKRGFFSKHILSKIIPAECKNNELIFDYLGEIKGPSTFMPRNKKHSEDITIITKILKNSKDENLSVIKLLFKTIFCNADWFNTTFILQDEDSITLVSNNINCIFKPIQFLLFPSLVSKACLMSYKLCNNFVR